MEKLPLFFTPVEEAEAVYLCLLLQVELVQEELGTHKSEEPVSKSIRKDWAGVPMEIVPAHSSSSSSSVRGSEAVARFCKPSGTDLNSFSSKSLGRAPVLRSKLRRFLWYLLKNVNFVSCLSSHC